MYGISVNGEVSSVQGIRHSSIDCLWLFAAYDDLFTKVVGVELASSTAVFKITNNPMRYINSQLVLDQATLSSNWNSLTTIASGYDLKDIVVTGYETVLGKDSSCRGVGDATSLTGVVSVTGKECGAEDNSGAATCSFSG
jgi:hypothetical protein